MININHVDIVGRLTKDIELKKTPSNLSVVTFNVAVDRRFKQEGQLDADFIPCVAWRQSAEFLAKYAHKGTPVGIEGKLQTRNYQDKDGKKVYVVEVICESVSIISMDGSANKTDNTPKASNVEDVIDDDFSNTPSLEISSDDLPFY